jgi:hypothetical protein
MAGGSVGQGSDWRSGQAMANAVHGVEVPWQKLCLSWTDDGDVPRCRFLPWSVNRSVIFPLGGLSSLGQAMAALVRRVPPLEESFWKIMLGQSTVAVNVVAREVEA